jgi:hypothetical protein
MRHKPIDVNRLREVLDYDPDSGKFTWRISIGKGKVENEAGRLNKRGYRVIGFDNTQYLAHRLAWSWYYGEDPADLQIDHIDKDKSNNEINNLRLASSSQNKRNTNIWCNNTSGTIGVSFDIRDKKWRVTIQINGERIQVGRFIHKADAINARLEAEDRYYNDGFTPNNPGREIIENERTI